MSWSITAVGKPKAVMAQVAKQIMGLKCSEPEESIKNSVGDIIVKALSAFPDGSAVQINASGSQSSVDYSKPELGSTNQLSVTIAPLWNFVE